MYNLLLKYVNYPVILYLQTIKFLHADLHLPNILYRKPVVIELLVTFKIDKEKAFLSNIFFCMENFHP